MEVHLMGLKGFLTSADAADVIAAGSILLVTFASMFAVRILWMRVLRPLVKRSGADLDHIVLPPARSLVLWGILLAGVYHAAASLAFVQRNGELKDALGKTLNVAWAVFAVWTSVRVLNAVAAWYTARAEARGAAGGRGHEARLVRKAANVILLALGLIYVLRAAGMDISPLLASGAIGGLAIGLAVQDTLSNLFAGFFLSIDRPVKVGDYVRLETGEEGFVEEIGWRNTKMRPWANNLVIIPNSKLSQSRITNYFLPQQETSVYVPCGVSYGSDLQQVEDLTVAVAREVMQRVEGSDPAWNPTVRWKEFGASAITFTTTLRVKEFSAQYALQSEFIKALHRRFGEAGIEIPSAAQTVILRSPADAPLAGDAAHQPTKRAA